MAYIVKKTSALLLTLVLSLMLTACGSIKVVDEQTYVSKKVGIDCSDGRVLRAFDNLSNRDKKGYGSRACVELSFDNDSALKEIQSSNDWHELPMPKDVREALYGTAKMHEALISQEFPEKAEHGYYYFSDKDSFLNAWRFTGAVYDTEKNILQLAVLDNDPQWRFREFPDKQKYYYEGQVYSTDDSNGVFVDGTWLISPDEETITAKAQFGEIKSKTNFVNEDAKLFKRHDLNMFLLSENNWLSDNKQLYIAEDYIVPNYKETERIEAIIFTGKNSFGEDEDFFKNDCVTIQDNELISAIASSMKWANSPNTMQDLDLNVINEDETRYIAIKYRELGALYYYGQFNVRENGQVYISCDWNGEYDSLNSYPMSDDDAKKLMAKLS